MAQYIADIQGQSGSTSRIGSKDSGISGHIRGWNAGVRVVGNYDEEAESDCFYIYATGGSNGARTEKLIGYVTEGGFHEVNE